MIQFKEMSGGNGSKVVAASTVEVAVISKMYIQDQRLGLSVLR